MYPQTILMPLNNNEFTINNISFRFCVKIDWTCTLLGGWQQKLNHFFSLSLACIHLFEPPNPLHAVKVWSPLQNKKALHIIPS